MLLNLTRSILTVLWIILYLVSHAACSFAHTYMVDIFFIPFKLYLYKETDVSTLRQVSYYRAFGVSDQTKVKKLVQTVESALRKRKAFSSRSLGLRAEIIIKNPSIPMTQTYYIWADGDTLRKEADAHGKRVYSYFFLPRNKLQNLEDVITGITGQSLWQRKQRSN